MKKMNIDELAQSYNKSNNKTMSDDKRHSNNITPRRIRDYVSKGLIDKPLRDGKFAFYTQRHLDQLLEIRNAQLRGFTESSIIKYGVDSFYDKKEDSKVFSQDGNLLRNKALDTIQSIEKKRKKEGNSTYKQNVFEKWNINHEFDFSVKQNKKFTEREIKQICSEVNNILKENYYDNN